ncbi:anti-sigma-D factor RsdA [Rhodococcus sp. NPDC058521]|uniref:anti-sigma-D factor RsdA n=1 Tax=Rhodococcus sp. NPDC058521 TaxID=3346536 RepID=UPI0036649433
MAKGNRRDGNPRADLPGDDTPVDVAAVRRDDAFIEALAGDGHVATETPEQYELALLLADWRSGIVSTPMPKGPQLDEVVAAIEKSNRTATTRSRMRLLRPIAGAAAAVAVVMGGATIFSYNAQPGDPLWNVKQVVFTQQADSTVAQIETTSQLEEAERLISSGDTDQARAMLETASARSGDVRDAGARGELEQWHARLATELEKLQPVVPGTAVPPAPGTTNQPPPSSTDPTVPGTQDPGTVPPGTIPSPWPDLIPPDLQIPPILPPPPIQQQAPDQSTTTDPSTDPSTTDPSTDPSTKPVDPTVMLRPVPDDTTPPETKRLNPPSTTTESPSTPGG